MLSGFLDLRKLKIIYFSQILHGAIVKIQTQVKYVKLLLT
jgi:hypothetical protein